MEKSIIEKMKELVGLSKKEDVTPEVAPEVTQEETPEVAPEVIVDETELSTDEVVVDEVIAETNEEKEATDEELEVTDVPVEELTLELVAQALAELEARVLALEPTEEEAPIEDEAPVEEEMEVQPTELEIALARIAELEAELEAPAADLVDASDATDENASYGVKMAAIHAEKRKELGLN